MTGPIKLPGGEIPRSKLCVQASHRRDIETGEVRISDGQVTVNRVTNMAADLVGLSRANIAEALDVGTIAFTGRRAR